MLSSCGEGFGVAGGKDYEELQKAGYILRGSFASRGSFQPKAFIPKVSCLARLLGVTLWAKLAGFDPLK